MRRTILRRTVVVPLVLMLSLLGPGAASASTLTQGTAYGYGASVSVLDASVISPTPEANAGPGPGTGSDQLVTVPLDTTAFTGVAGAKAQTTAESTIGSELGSQYLRVVEGGPELPSQYNVQAYARTTGAAVVADEVLDADTVTSIIDEIGLGEGEVFPALVSADLVHSEALVSCTDGTATVVAGGQVAGLGVLGSSLTDTVDGTANQVIDLGDTVIGSLGGTLVVNEVIETATGVEVNALRLTIPGVTEVILAHTEVSDADCLQEEPEELVRTGGNGAALGLTVLGAGGLLMLAAVRMRKTLFANNS